VFIDGIAQLKSPYVVEKPVQFQVVPQVPNFDKEAKEAIKYEGLQPLTPSDKVDSTIFRNVRRVYHRDTSGRRVRSQDYTHGSEYGVVVVKRGKIVCQRDASHCAQYRAQYPPLKEIDLEGGVIAPGMLTYGGPIGLAEIEAESSTNDGVAFAPIKQTTPELIGDHSLMRAADGLQFQGRDTLFVAFARFDLY
jgi:hypothetical protein